MKFITISLMAWGLVACSSAATKTESPVESKQSNADNAPAASSLESDSSEGVVGPDDAYFAGVYLESVFKASKSNPHPALDNGLSLSKDKPVEAFDFAANFQAKRLKLMSGILMALGDKDKDGQLSSEEFLAIQLMPELQGASEAISHEFDKELFDAAAGEDELLSREEIADLLVKVASESQLSKLSKQDIRKALEQGWEKILASYDEDKDGKTSLSEQRKLRKERANLISRFAAE